MTHGVRPPLTARAKRPRAATAARASAAMTAAPRVGDRVGVGEHFDLHGGYAVTVGFCQPPGGVTLSPTSFGPQVPGSYS